MGFRVKIDDRDFKDKSEKLARNLEEADFFLDDVGRAVVQDVRNRVITGDGGAWAPASRWVQAKKGEPIDIQEHHDGATLDATGEHVDLYLVDPAKLRLKSNNFSFRWLRSSVVPARRIWPDGPGEVEAIVGPALSRYLERVRGRTFE